DEGESCSSCATDCGSCSGGGNGGSGGGGGGGSGGGGGETPPEEPEEGTCVEDWICTDWTECVSGKKTRTCADVNRCGTTENMPEEIQDCEIPAVCEPGETACEGNNLVACSETGESWIVLQECEF
ncbi:MAG: hypothetical protein GTN38_02975, partial [Candidatus Aenigmarchaeota archaeon]|nr:hypothetical protein [Candidatus Aenigmarchaeota archaeon]NIP41104.1 hypothetical protein [Candidatus Aenigmarchaeota archaeon]NIQ17603.1 hypothetical protein [Candidatus Aenigmarchaeota archaeon]